MFLYRSQIRSFHNSHVFVHAFPFAQNVLPLFLKVSSFLFFRTQPKYDTSSTPSFSELLFPLSSTILCLKTTALPFHCTVTLSVKGLSPHFYHETHQGSNLILFMFHPQWSNPGSGTKKAPKQLLNEQVRYRSLKWEKSIVLLVPGPRVLPVLAPFAQLGIHLT